MELIHRAAAIYKEKGAGGVFIRGLKKMLKVFFETNSAIWFERNLALNLPYVITKIPIAVDSSATNETINWIKNNGESWMFDQREIKIGLAENHLFPNVKYENKIIGYAKIGLNKVFIQDFQKTITLPPDFAFIYDTYVVPKYRGFNMAPFLIKEVISYLKSNGIRKIGCHIPGWNTASIRSYTKLGFRRINYIRYFRIFGFKIFTTNPERVYSLKAQ